MNKWYGRHDKDLMQEILEYCEKRDYLMPNTWEAMGWVNAEIGEVYEVLLSKGGWVRNNPEDHPEKGDQELAEELGDVIFMIMIAGHSREVNPLDAMLNKMSRKLTEKRVEKPSESLGMKQANAVGDAEEELREDY